MYYFPPELILFSLAVLIALLATQKRQDFFVPLSAVAIIALLSFSRLSYADFSPSPYATLAGRAVSAYFEGFFSYFPVEEPFEQEKWDLAGARERIFRSDGIHAYPSGKDCLVPAYATRNISAPGGFSVELCSPEDAVENNSFYIVIDGLVSTGEGEIPPGRCKSYSYLGPVLKSFSIVPLRKGACEKEDIIIKAFWTGERIPPGRTALSAQTAQAQNYLNFSGERFYHAISGYSENCPPRAGELLYASPCGCENESSWISFYLPNNSAGNAPSEIEIGFFSGLSESGENRFSVLLDGLPYAEISSPLWIYSEPKIARIPYSGQRTISIFSEKGPNCGASNFSIAYISARGDG